MGQADRPDNTTGWGPDELDRSLQLAKALPGFDGFRFDPVALIKAANFFHGLGFAESLRALHLTGQIGAEPGAIDPENILLIARVLYVPVDAEEAFPRLDLGLPDLEEPQDPDLFPLFPLHLVNDLPLLLTGGYLVGGEGQPPSVYLDWCAGQARLRPAPLHPDNKPLAAVEAFLESEAWQRLSPDGFHAGMLRLQALRTLPRSLQATKDERQAMLATTEATPFWLAQLDKEERMNVAWNSSLNEFQTD
jgi:hypothetical protein